MLFSSNIFLFLFLPVTLLIYNLLNKKFKNIFLLVMSLGFYAWGEPKFVFIMIISIVFNYLMALLVVFLNESIFLKRIALIVTIVINLGLLFVFKYLDFFIVNINKLGFNYELKHIALPIGISFFTFQAMSYVIDAYRGDVEVQRKLHNVGLYISFFPQLIAGPIVRYKDIAQQMEDREENFQKFSEGVERFIIGFSKKVLLSNNMAIIADDVFALSDVNRAISLAWLGAIAYSFQILFDFSGYSDMAIGLGKMFGFEFLENFNYPYISKSISEFWRRWHMSLGQWFRDYLYFPLGGSRVKSKSRLFFNLFIVWFLTGVWHGASWNFILWGLLYFVLISIEKFTGYPEKFKSKVSQNIYRGFTLLSVLFGWVLFRANGLDGATGYMKSMMGLANNKPHSIETSFYFKEYWLFFLFSFFASTRIFKNINEQYSKNNKSLKIAYEMFHLSFYLLTFLWSISYIILGSHNPFIYFNF